jgi:hypothetical protein
MGGPLAEALNRIGKGYDSDTASVYNYNKTPICASSSMMQLRGSPQTNHDRLSKICYKRVGPDLYQTPHVRG